MQYTPPHSPDSHPHPHPPHLQFAKRTMDPSHLPDPDPGQFAKRPISPPLSSGEISDCHGQCNGHHHIHGQAPVSLLTALMHSPSSNPTSSNPGLLSPHSSVPSTAVSSPHLRPVTSQSGSQGHGNGGLDVPAMSILRRDSISSDGEGLVGNALGMEQARPRVQPQQQQAGTQGASEMVKRASSLKFAVAPPLKRRSASNTNTKAGDDHAPSPDHVPKFDIPITAGDTEDSPTKSLDKENDNDDDNELDSDEADVDLDMPEDGSEESDLGYQEDSEQSDDEEQTLSRVRVGPKYPFARSTNYRRRRKDLDSGAGEDVTGSPSPPPAPAVLPPPSRRGRGHIRVDESCLSEAASGTGTGTGIGAGNGVKKGCSRHRSPPPSKPASRSGSRSRRTSEAGLGERIGRLSDAGPRQNRAGSPMPSKSKILEATDAEAELEMDEEDEDLPRAEGVYGQIGQDVFGSWAPASKTTAKAHPQPRDGWRSDDAAFYGPNSKVKGIRTVSAPHHRKQFQGNGSAIVSDEDMDMDMDTNEAPGMGVRSFFRRASEHLPLPISVPIFKSGSGSGSRSTSVSHDHSNARSPGPGLCPPALDDTPALAHSISRVESEYSGGLAHRLERSLSVSHSARSVSAAAPEAAAGAVTEVHA